MPPKPKDGVAAQAALNIRLTTDDLGLLDRLVEIEAKEVAARFGGDATYVDVTRASLVRKWIRNAAREKGLIAQAVLPFEQPPAPPVVHVDIAPVVPPPAPAPPVPVVPPPAPAPPVVPPPVAEEASPGVTAPKRTKRKAPDADAVRAALIAAAAKPGEQTRIGNLAKIDSGSLSKFKSSTRPLSAEKLADLARELTKAGYLA